MAGIYLTLPYAIYIIVGILVLVLYLSLFFLFRVRYIAISVISVDLVHSYDGMIFVMIITVAVVTGVDIRLIAAAIIILIAIVVNIIIGNIAK